MKTITIGDKEIKLNIGEHITVKEMRVVYPIINKYGDNEIEMIIQICKELGDEGTEEIVDSLRLEEFTVLSEEITKFLSTKKK